MNKKAFTLIEVLVWVSIILIIVLMIWNINFIYISDKQKIEWFNNKIISEIERIRSDSLVWKWIWVNLNVAHSWKIDFATTWNWIMNTSYKLTETWTWNLEKSLPMETFSISLVSCISVSWTETILSNTQIWSIIFEWGKYKLWWNCTENNHSTIRVESSYRWNNYRVEFDTISWIIKR